MGTMSGSQKIHELCYVKLYLQKKFSRYVSIPVNIWESTKYIEILLFFVKNYYIIQCPTPLIVTIFDKFSKIDC